MKIIFRMSLYVSILLFFSCHGAVKKEAKDFYFPYRNFIKGTTYTYVNEGDSTDRTVWRMKTEVDGKDTLLLTDIYNGKNEEQEALKEKITEQGSVMVNYLLYFPDSTRTSKYEECKVKED